MIAKVTKNGFNKTESAALATKAAALARKKGDKRLKTTGMSSARVLQKALETQKWTKLRNVMNLVYNMAMEGDLDAAKAYFHFMTGPHVRKQREAPSGSESAPHITVAVQNNAAPPPEGGRDFHASVYSTPALSSAPAPVEFRPPDLDTHEFVVAHDQAGRTQT